MSAVERIVNLALFLAASREPVTADLVRSEGIYPEGQEDAAFLRMFERDKDELRAMGFAIDSSEDGTYRLDASRTYASHVELSAADVAVIQVACSALLDDPSFPFGDELRLAWAKVAAESTRADVVAAARLADEHPEEQGETVVALTKAAAACKRVDFGYTNSAGLSAPHTVEPYGLFLHDGRWYLVGRDLGLDQVRTYAVTRMYDVTPNTIKPRSPDFEPPADFDVSTYIRLPFQYGPDSEVATVDIKPAAAWRAVSLTAAQGELSPVPDGSLTWKVSVRSRRRFARFLIENGPGLVPVAPASLVSDLRSGLAKVEASHG